MDRRQFLTAAAAFAVSAAAQTTTTQQATLRTSSATPPLPVMPLDFMGLSYESAQLTNPDYFSAKNTDLVSKFRRVRRQNNVWAHASHCVAVLKGGDLGAFPAHLAGPL